MVPALIASGGALNGCVDASDFGIDATGSPILAPIGPHDSHVARTLADAIAPEVAAGQPPTPSAALYGLGVVLYRLVTGRPPGSARAPASTHNHRVGPDLDKAIDLLLSADPTQRPSALPFLQRAATPADLRRHVPAARTTGLVKAATSQLVQGAHPVVVDIAALRALSPRQLSAAAGHANMASSQVRALTNRGLPLVLERIGSAQEATRRAEDLTSRLQLPVTTAPDPLAGTGFVAPATVVVGSVGLLLTAGLTGAFGPLALPLAIPAVLITAWGARFGSRRSRGQRLARAARDAGNWQQASRDGRATWPEVHSVEQRIARMRQDLVAAQLPDAADADIRSAIKAVEGQLERMIEVLDATERVLAAVDLGDLRTRVALTERGGGAQSDDARSLAGTIADLEAVQRRRDRQRARVSRLEVALDALSAALASEGLDGADGSLARILATTRGLAAATEDAP
jgi:hypothetical protein